MATKRHLWLALGVAATWIVGAAIGCEAAGGSTDFGSGGAGAGQSTGGTGTGTGTGGDVGVGGASFDAGNQDGNISDADTCLSEEAQAEKIPLDIFIVVDRSGSMGSCSSGNWPDTEDALRAFINDPASAEISVGLNFFPAPGTSGNECDPSLFNPVQVPADLPLLLLPDDVAELEAAFDALHPSSCTEGTTPMYGALYGTYQTAVAYQGEHPDRKVIVVLTGDGEPCCGDCSDFFNGAQYEEIPAIASIALSARGNGVLTYTIIIDSAAADALDAIAEQGGTGQAFDVSSNISTFIQALQDIRAQALGCEYAIPEPQEEEFDPLKLNVVYTPGGALPETIPQAATQADCGALDGWYYDDPQTPTKVILCPHTCSKVQADADAHVGLAFGCPTEVN